MTAAAALRSLAGLALLAMVVVGLVDVVGRGVFNAPLLGGTEITETLMVLLVFGAYPLLAWRQQHITVDLVPGARGPLLRRMQRLLTNGITAAVFAGLSWRLGVLAERAADYGEKSSELGIPQSWVLAFMSVLSAITAALALARAVGVASGAGRVR